MLFVVYLLILSFSISIILWIMLKSMRNYFLTPPTDDDEGGISPPKFPIIDLPPEGHIEDLLVDRWHGDIAKPVRRNKA